MILCRKPRVKRHSPGVRESDILAEWPCADIDHVMVFGNVQITTQALQHLLKRGIELAIFTRHGNLLGQLTPPMGKNVFLRLHQFEKYKDDNFRLNFSRNIVAAKIDNALCMLRQHLKNHPYIIDPDQLDVMNQYVGKIHSCEEHNVLLGLEGSASAHYFKLLSIMLPSPWQFDGRSKRPPRDPANAVLSFGYTIISSEISSLLDGVGFDPCLGFYHEAAYGRPSLALDLMEAFRHPLIDRLMLNLFNLNILNREDFIPVRGGGIYLSESGKRKFIGQYERMMGKLHDDVPDESNEDKFRAAFQDQVALLAKAVKDEATFCPFRLEKGI